MAFAMCSVAQLAVVAALALPADAQGSVAGRVSIQERPTETTTDLGSTVIYLLPVDSASVPTKPMRSSLVMTGRSFAPRLRVVTPGSRVEFPNQDPFSHNTFSITKGAQFDLGLYPAGKSKDVIFKQPGVFPVYCNIHPRMTAFVVVAPTPWVAQAGNDGRWTIANVPAGRYVLHAWHERAKETETVIVVPATGVSDLASVLDARGFRIAQHKNKFGKEYDKTGKDRY